MSVLLVFFLILFAGYIFGKWNEDKHLQDLKEREKVLAHVRTRNTGKKETFANAEGVLVSGSVVVAQDAFKAFLASLVLLVGGRISVYESLMERARREAVLRAKEQAQILGATEMVNVRLQTAAVGFSSKNNQPSQSSSVEVLCYATALVPKA